MFELPRGITNISNHFLLFAICALWLFWCAGYIPKIKHNWRNIGGVAVIANLVLTSLIILKIIGI